MAQGALSMQIYAVNAIQLLLEAVPTSISMEPHSNLKLVFSSPPITAVIFPIHFPHSRPPIDRLHRIYQLDLTFWFIILRTKFRNRTMLFDETLIKLLDTDIGYKRTFCLTA